MMPANSLIKNNFNEAVDTAIKASQDHTYRTSDDNTTRLSDNISASLDKAMHLRNDVNSQLQQAESYRQTASFAEEHAFSINSNENQAFVNYMLSDEGGHKSMSQIREMQKEGSGSFEGQQAWRDFAAHQTESLRQQFTQDSGGMSAQSIKQDANGINQSMATSTTIEGNYSDNAIHVWDKGLSQGIDKSQAIDKGAETEVAWERAQADYEVNKGKERLHDMSMKGSKAIVDETNK